jgi:hypothetical protein
LEGLIEVAEAIGADVGAGFAKGIDRGFEKNQRIDDLLNRQQRYTSSGLPGSSADPTSPRVNNPGNPNILTPRRRLQHGGDFVVPPGFPNDTYPMLVSSGERVTVQPQGQASSQIVVNVNGIGGADLAAIIRRKVEQGVQEYHDQVIVPWSNG